MDAFECPVSLSPYEGFGHMAIVGNMSLQQNDSCASKCLHSVRVLIAEVKSGEMRSSSVMLGIPYQAFPKIPGLAAAGDQRSLMQSASSV